MFSKLLQLQLAPNPSEIIEWMFDHGVNQTVNHGFQKMKLKISPPLAPSTFQSGQQILIRFFKIILVIQNIF